MKNPLHYQITDYDCGPTSMLNGISYLFEREEIPPEIMRNIVLYCLDCHGRDGVPGKRGTSCSAMMFLSSWLDGFGKMELLPISSSYISGKGVYIGQQSLINDTLIRGGAVVVRLFYDEWHYVLLTGIDGDNLLVFDPYYREEPFEDENIKIVNDNLFKYNRIVPISYFNQQSETLYSFGGYDTREAVLLFNTNTKITQEDTVEYFI
jgi:hypothetical protein